MTLTIQQPIDGEPGGLPDPPRDALLALLETLDVGFVLYDERRIARLSNDAMRRLVPADDGPLVGRDQRGVLALVAGRCTDVSARRLTDHLDGAGEEVLELNEDPPGHLQWRRIRLGGWLADTFQPQTAARDVERQTVEFMSGAAHDLKTPITSIKGYAQLSLRRADADDPRLRQNLHGIADQSDRLVRLIDTIVDVSRVRLGRFELHRATCDLGEIVRTLVEAHGVWNDRHTFQAIVEPEALSFWGDANRLRRTIESLIDNAVKFSPNGGNVWVSARADGDRIVVAVEDEGVGMSEAARAQVFAAAWARPGSGVARPRRTGLSLPMALRVAEAHGGTLRLENSTSGGTRAVLDLPLVAESS